jgi:hypothetical protein
MKPYVKRGKTAGETGPWPQMRPRKRVERHAAEFKPVRVGGLNDQGGSFLGAERASRRMRACGTTPIACLRHDAGDVGGSEAPNAARATAIGTAARGRVPACPAG